MPSPFVAAAMLIAFVGWFATLVAIKRSGYSARTKYLLMIPSWIPWLVLAPLLLGLRHGFTRALCSALCLDGLLLLEARGAGRPLPGVLCLGILLTAMLAGEFCDLWQRRLQQLDELNRYRREHLAHFTRAYHLLALSHERLERRALCNTRSLREALSELRRRLIHQAGLGEPPWEALAQLFALLGDFLQTRAEFVFGKRWCSQRHDGGEGDDGHEPGQDIVGVGEKLDEIHRPALRT